VLLHDDLAAAGIAADEAARRATDDVRIPALVAQGWVAVAGGDRDRAAALAGEAVAHAHRGGHRTGLAEALELRAAAEPDPAKARRALREAHAIWTGAGAVAHAARVLLAASRLPGAGAEERLSALFAAERLVAEGLSPDPYPAGDGDAAHPGTQAGVLVRTFGRFEVWLGDRPVPATSWQSRRARDLLRILVVRRGRPVPRGELCELLWPDDDAAKTGHRLSVLLSIVRGVLDPAKRYEPDHYLVADAASVALDVTQLRVDVLEFLAAVAHGRRLFERDAVDEARAALAAADRDYTADVFADEPYADWADALREQARAAHIGALRLLAQASRAAGATAPAVEYLLRLLEKDPYDEPAHRALVRTLAVAGQHGEARRALARYRAAMTEIGVRPQDIPMPVALSSRPPPSRTR
jgi:DNA-binding SARP family transcriptional activator